MGSRKIELLYYDCRGLSNEKHVYEFEKTLDKIKWDIVGISGVRKRAGVD